MDLGSKGLFAGERSGVKNHKNLRLRKKLINEGFTIVNVTLQNYDAFPLNASKPATRSKSSASMAPCRC